jgi:N6-adenosine-specific RNA methylase IME4
VSLFPDPVAPGIEGIDLRCCGVVEVLREVRGARLIMADPPWRYAREAGGANPEENGIYNGLSEPEIVAHLDAAFDCAGPACRLACWYTWPKEDEWRTAGMAGPRWGRKVSGGAWLKTSHWCGSSGVGYHWRGQTEPIAVFVKGACGRSREGTLKNGHASISGEHSEKPLDWLRAMVRAWTEPGDLVLDLYAGMAPVARACLLEGRRYVGAEIDPKRHARAMAKLWRCR